MWTADDRHHLETFRGILDSFKSEVSAQVWPLPVRTSSRYVYITDGGQHRREGGSRHPQE